MRRVSVALSALALLARCSCSSAAPPPRRWASRTYRFLPAQVFGAVAIGMPDPRTVSIQHHDAATGQWDAPATWCTPRAG